MSDSETIPGGLPPAPPNSYNPTINADLPIGTPVYVEAGGGCNAAKADNATTAYCTGLLIARGEAGKRCPVRYAGLVQLTTAEWTALLDTGTELTPGAPYYASASVAGKISKLEPEAGFAVQLGIANSTHALLVLLTVTPING